jgi:hypothetical protein
VVSLFFTICAIAGAGLAIALVVVFPVLLAAFGLTSLDYPIIGYLRWPVMFVLIILGLAVLYRYGPSRRVAKWRWISVGSVFAGLAWLAVSSLFSTGKRLCGLTKDAEEDPGHLARLPQSFGGRNAYWLDRFDSEIRLDVQRPG